MSMDCRRARARVIALIDGELPAAEADALRAHLADCPDCRLAHAAESELTARVRATAAGERAPQRLLERVRAGLAEVEREMAAAEAPAPRRALSVKVSPRARGWGLTLAAAAAMLLIVAGGLLWPASDRSLVQAMAAEHYEHSGPAGGAPKLTWVTGDAAEIEKHLQENLGLPVRLPTGSFPEKKGAECCRLGARDMGLVACFCARRNHAVSLFIVRAEGVSLAGLEEKSAGGRTFWRGEAGRCRAIMWKSGGLLYALVGDFKDPADQLDLASRAARTIDERP